jgi:hypothetical protein
MLSRSAASPYDEPVGRIKLSQVSDDIAEKMNIYGDFFSSALLVALQKRCRTLDLLL